MIRKGLFLRLVTATFFLCGLFSLYGGEEGRSLFLRAQEVSKDQKGVPEGKKYFNCKDFTKIPENAAKVVNIAAPYVDGVFKEIFATGDDKGKERLMSFLNALYFPEDKDYKITKVDYQNENVNGRHFDVTCTAIKRQSQEEIVFDIEMQNQYLSLDMGRFVEYATIIKAKNPERMVKVLVLLNRLWETGASEKKINHNEFGAFCLWREGENGEWDLVRDGSGRPAIKKELPQINQIDIRSAVERILEGKSVSFNCEGEARKLTGAALEWIKLFGVAHWATKIESGSTKKKELYAVPGEGIDDKKVQETVLCLEKFAKKENYIDALGKLREEMEVGKSNRKEEAERIKTGFQEILEGRKGLDEETKKELWSDFLELCSRK